MKGLTWTIVWSLIVAGLIQAKPAENATSDARFSLTFKASTSEQEINAIERKLAGTRGVKGVRRMLVVDMPRNTSNTTLEVSAPAKFYLTKWRLPPQVDRVYLGRGFENPASFPKTCRNASHQSSLVTALAGAVILANQSAEDAFPTEVWESFFAGSDPTVVHQVFKAVSKFSPRTIDLRCWPHSRDDYCFNDRLGATDRTGIILLCPLFFTHLATMIRCDERRRSQDGSLLQLLVQNTSPHGWEIRSSDAESPLAVQDRVRARRDDPTQPLTQYIAAAYEYFAVYAYWHRCALGNRTAPLAGGSPTSAGQASNPERLGDGGGL
ncbi:MAG: hypothetical protein M1838_000840 [Thelocarpon superellum]|nr:MAG: hypothetical protein M1838_000840 [Thelocarpon superellum]